MTGYYVRAQDESGRWCAVEIDRMTDVQLDAFRDRVCDRGAEVAMADGWKWALALARWIRDHVYEDRSGGGTDPCSCWDGDRANRS